MILERSKIKLKDFIKMIQYNNRLIYWCYFEGDEDKELCIINDEKNIDISDTVGDNYVWGATGCFYGDRMVLRVIHEDRKEETISDVDYLHHDSVTKVENNYQEFCDEHHIVNLSHIQTIKNEPSHTWTGRTCENCSNWQRKEND